MSEGLHESKYTNLCVNINKHECMDECIHKNKYTNK